MARREMARRSAAALARQERASYVRDARDALAITQQEFAIRLGVTRRTIIRYEQGDALPVPVRLAIEHLLTRKTSSRTRS